WTHLLNPADEDRIVRFETIRNDAQPVFLKRAGLDAPVLDFVVGIDDVHKLLALLGAYSAVNNEQCRVRLPDGQADADEHPRGEQAYAAIRLGIWKHPPNADAARGGIDLVVDEINRPVVRHPFFTLQTHQDRVLTLRGRLEFAGIPGPAKLQQRWLVHFEPHVDGIERHYG